MKINKKKIAVVTGGAGFIGSHMVDLLLKKKYEVRVIDNFPGGHRDNLKKHKNNKNLKLKEINILKININDKVFKNVEFIFHFAGIGDIVPSIEKPISYMNTNIMGTVNILEAARLNKVSKFVYAASSSCYGIASTPTKENHRIDPLYPYALSKNMGEQAVMHWGRVYNLPVISIRIFNAYGERVRTTGAYGAVFGVFFKQKISNKPFTVVGDGDQKRDFIYVTDVVNAFYMSAKSKYKNEIFNLGEGKPKSINLLIKLIGGGKVTYLPNRPGEPKITLANISKIRKFLNWKTKVSFKEGVQLMLRDIYKWEKAPLWDKKSISKATKMWFRYMGNKNL